MHRKFKTPGAPVGDHMDINNVDNLRKQKELDRKNNPCFECHQKRGRRAKCRQRKVRPEKQLHHIYNLETEQGDDNPAQVV